MRADKSLRLREDIALGERKIRELSADLKVWRKRVKTWRSELAQLGRVKPRKVSRRSKKEKLKPNHMVVRERNARRVTISTLAVGNSTVMPNDRLWNVYRDLRKYSSKTGAEFRTKLGESGLTITRVG